MGAGDDGEVSEQTRTYWSTEFVVLDFPGVGWTDAQTVSYRDANLDNDRLGTQYLAMNRANSISELQAAQEEYQGIPFFNTIAVGADGWVWYADTAATPNLSPEAMAAYEERLEREASPRPRRTPGRSCWRATPHVTAGSRTPRPRGRESCRGRPCRSSNATTTSSTRTTATG